jgi:hypothetical protein
MYELAEITAVQVLDGFNIRLTFEDGTVKTVNFDRYISNGPIFGALRTDPDLFQAAFVENGTITWPNGADIDPDVLYLGLPPHASEEEYEAAKAAHAAQQVVR